MTEPFSYPEQGDRLVPWDFRSRRGVVGWWERAGAWTVAAFLPAPCYSFSGTETFGPQRAGGSRRVGAKAELRLGSSWGTTRWGIRTMQGLVHLLLAPPFRPFLAPPFSHVPLSLG